MGRHTGHAARAVLAASAVFWAGVLGWSAPGQAKATPSGGPVLRSHPGPGAEAEAVRRFQDAMARGGMPGVSGLVEGCYRMAGSVPQATADCLLLDVAAMLFDAAQRKLQAQAGRGDPGPTTPFLAVQAYSARLDTIGPAVFGPKPRAMGLYLGRAPDRVMASLAARPLPGPAAPPPVPPPVPSSTLADAAPAAPPQPGPAVEQIPPAPASVQAPPPPEPARPASVRLQPGRTEPPRGEPEPPAGAQAAADAPPAAPMPATSGQVAPSQAVPSQAVPSQAVPSQAAPVQAELVGPIRAHPGAQTETETIQRFRIAMAEDGIRQAAQAIQSCYDKAAPRRQATADCLLWDAAAILVEIAPRTMLIQQGRIDPGAATEFFTPDAFQARRNRYGTRVFGANPDALAAYLGQAPERVMEAVLRQPTPPAGTLVLQVPAPPEAASPPALPAGVPSANAPRPAQVRLTPRATARQALRTEARPSQPAGAPERTVPTMLGPLY